MRITKVASLLVIAFLALTAAGASFAGKQQTGSKLTAKEVRTLIATAKTPEDHLNLAAYYRDKAAEAKAQAAEHETMLAAYHANPGSHPIAKAVGGPSEHCRTLIRLFNDEAKQDLALAAEHEKMAKAASRNP